MISPAILEKLEFPKVLQFISRYALTEPGKNDILKLSPFPNIRLTMQEGEYVNEAKEIIIKNDFPPISYIVDLSKDLSTSAIENAVLDNKTILEILRLAETSRNLYQFLKRENEAKNLNSDFINQLFVDKVFEHHISKVIDENGDVRENASTKLKEIREEVRHKSDSLRKVVNRILKELSESYLVREEYFTQRDGRIVLPVKAEHKRHVKGFIHSESSTGQTVYIEPEETLELNNDLLSLYFAEKREIGRILRELTKKIGEVSDQLKTSLEVISTLDSIFARAKYSIEIIGAFPSFDEKQPIKLMDARHPILLKKLGKGETVPLNLEIDKQNVILITGPNAGGKTVVLKSTGLLAVMALSGIHIPVHPDSNLHFFTKILIDIGDQQSIEDDLSTFSSHLSNIRIILKEADDNTLVLLDEIGTGTDPAEGSALAVAVLITLQKKSAKVLATTHHGSLKLIANELEGFQNASMEFDNEKLAPTYYFKQGVPGSSYAFEVAGRIGFDRSFINLAKEYLDSDKMKVEDFLIELETRSRDLQQKLNESEIENARLKGLTNLYKQNVEKIEKQKKEILNEAKTKAELFLRDVNRTIENAVKEIRESKAESNVVKDIKKQIEELKAGTRKIIPEEKIVVPVEEELQVNDYAEIKSSHTSGKIIEIDRDKNRATLLVGNIKMQVKLSELTKIKKKEAEQKQQSITVQSLNASYRIDIRGKRPEEAEFEVIKFVDDAYTSGMDRVEILHGKGTGALKKMVKDVLTEHPAVSKHYFANIEYGGDGVTIVELR